MPTQDLNRHKIRKLLLDNKDVGLMVTGSGGNYRTT